MAIPSLFGLVSQDTADNLSIVGTASADLTSTTTRPADDNSGSATNPAGFKINPNDQVDNVSVRISGNADGITNVTIWDISGADPVKVETVTGSWTGGDWVSFSSSTTLSSGTAYSVMAWNDGAGHTQGWKVNTAGTSESGVAVDITDGQKNVDTQADMANLDAIEARAVNLNDTEGVIEDWEDGNINVENDVWGDGWGGATSDANADLSADSSNPIAGSFSGNFSTTNNNANDKVYLNTSDGNLRQPSRIEIHYRPMVDTDTEGDDTNFYFIDTAQSGRAFGVRLAGGDNSGSTTQAEGRFALGDDNNGIGVKWFAGTTYNMTFSDIDWANHTFDFWINGTRYANDRAFTADNNGNNRNGIDQIYWQIDSAASGQTRYGYMDDLTLGSASGGGGGGSSSNDVSGTVVDQNGNPIEDATVQIWGVDYSAANDISTSEDANQLIQDLSDPVPDDWSSDLQLTGSGDAFFESADTNYVAVTETSVSGDPWLDSADLGSPLLRPPADRELVLTVWDPNAGLLSGLDEYDSQLPGQTVDDANIVIEQMGGQGDVMDRTTEPLDQTAGGGFLDPSSLSYATVQLPPGYYRIYPEGSPESSYVIQVGTHQDIIQTLSDDVTNVNGSVSDVSNEVSDRLNNNTFTRTTVVTGADGEFTADVGANVKTVGIQAYKAPDEADITKSRTDITIEDLRTSFEDADGSFSYHLPSGIETRDVPANNVEITVREVSSPPFGNLSDYANRTELLNDLLGNLSYSDLPDSLQQRLDGVNRSELEDLHDDLASLADQNDELRDRVQELLDDRGQNTNIIINESDASTDDLRERIAALQQSLDEVRDNVESGETIKEVGQDTVSLTFPFDTELEDDQVALLVHYSNGTTKTLSTDSKYVSVNSRIGRGDQVVLEDFPLGNSSTPVANFEALVATPEGTGSASEVVKNPTFEGKVPSLNSVTLSTLHPGPSETVNVDLNPKSDVGYNKLTAVTVYHNGSKVSANIEDDDEANFTTTGAGTYHIRATYTNLDNQNFTTTFRVSAADSQLGMPPGVRVVESSFGTYALAGDGLKDAQVNVEQNGRSLEVAPVLEQDADIPPNIQVYAVGVMSGPESTANIRVLRGDVNGETVKQHTTITLHTGTLSDDPIVYRERTQPIVAEGTQYGEIKESNGTQAIRTFTTGDGTVQIDVDTDPSTIENLIFDFRVRTGLTFDIPAVGMIVPIGAPVSGHGGSGLPVLGAGIVIGTVLVTREDDQ